MNRKMPPGARLDLIKRIAPKLAAMNNGFEIWFHFREFGFVADRWEESDLADISEWLFTTLRGGNDDLLNGLADYLFGNPSPIDLSKQPWRRGEFRLFLSHVAAEQASVSGLSDALAWFGVHGFLAHDHIAAGQDWVNVLQAGLFSCDALVAVLHDGFRASEWTDQEVGFVLGQGKFAIALRSGLDPHGFLGLVQGLSISPEKHWPAVASEIVKVLSVEPRTAMAMRDALVTRLVHSTSFNQSNTLADILRQSHKITRAQYESLRQAQKENREVGQSHAVGPFLDNLSTEFEEPL
jgi:TIR domain